MWDLFVAHQGNGFLCMAILLDDFKFSEKLFAVYAETVWHWGIFQIIDLTKRFIIYVGN